MILLTDTQRDRLLANGRDRDQDHIPVVKFFNPFGAGVWLATELDEDPEPCRPVSGQYPGGPACDPSEECCAKYSSGRARTSGSLSARATGPDL